MALSRRTKVLLLVTSPAQLLSLLLVAWFLYTAHRPWEIPAAHRPPASWQQKPERGLAVRSLGVSGFEISDGVTTLLLDPTPTRPPPWALISGTIDADPALGEKWCPKADAVLVNHAHFDHVLDAGDIAKRTGALVVGSQNTVNFALSKGVAPERTRVVRDGERLTVGTFTIDVKASRHTDLLVSQPMSGVIVPAPRTLWFWQYALDDTFAYRLEAGGTTLWFHPTSTFADGELGGLTAKNLIVGVSGEKQTAAKVKGLVREAQPARVMPTHFDNFFQPLDLGLALLPGTDLDAVKALFLAEAPGLEWGVTAPDETVYFPPDAP